MKIAAAIRTILSGEIGRLIQDEENQMAKKENGQKRMRGRQMVKMIVDYHHKEVKARNVYHIEDLMVVELRNDRIGRFIRILGSRHTGAKVAPG